MTNPTICVVPSTSTRHDASNIFMRRERFVAEERQTQGPPTIVQRNVRVFNTLFALLTHIISTTIRLWGFVTTMMRRTLFLVAFTSVVIGSFIVITRVKYESRGFDGEQQHDSVADTKTKRDLRQKDTRMYDLLMEFDEEDDIRDPMCVQDVVKDDLAENVFNFMLENDLVERHEKEDFIEDWEVDVLSFNEVEVIETRPGEGCPDTGCRLSEIGCKGPDCERLLTRTYDSKQATRRRRWKKNKRRKRYVIRTRTKCSLCYPDNKAAGRKLQSEREFMELKNNAETNGLASASLRGSSSEIRELLDRGRALGGSSSGSSDSEEEKLDVPNPVKNRRSPPANKVNGAGQTSKKMDSNGRVTDENQEVSRTKSQTSHQENKVASEGLTSKKTRSYGESTAEKQGEYKTSYRDGGDWDWEEIIIYLQQVFDTLLQRFQERTGQEFSDEIRDKCYESPTRAELIYVGYA